MPLLHITLLYLPAKIIFASGNFKHALYTAVCNLHAQLQRDQTRRCREKNSYLHRASPRSRDGEYSKPDASQCKLNYIESRSVYTNAPLSRPLCSASIELWTRHSDRAAGLKRFKCDLAFVSRRTTSNSLLLAGEFSKPCWRTKRPCKSSVRRNDEERKPRI